MAVAARPGRRWGRREIERWQGPGGDPSSSPFEPSSDVGWFHRELVKDAPELEILSDAVPNPTKRPVWLSTEPEPPARVIAIRLTLDTPRDVLELIFGLATKYDLVLYNALTHRVNRPPEQMEAYASATFWPSGAIRGAVAGVIGALMFVAGYLLGIPVVSWLLEIVGGFLVALTVFTFIHEARKAMKERRQAP